MRSESLYFSYLSTPVGRLIIEADDLHLHKIAFHHGRMRVESPDASRHIKECLRQLEEYFQGKRKKFNLRLNLCGSEFQKKVWLALQNVGYGKTASYQDIARQIGSPKAVRAVGGANHANPFTIVVPCHRIIGSRGDLVGYGGGLDKKTWLLRHEQKSSLSNH